MSPGTIFFFIFLLYFPFGLFGQASSSCDCWQQRDNTFQVVKFNGSGANGGPGTAPGYRNDDWSTNQVAIPFNFCFYGTNYNKIYINNNGNISFGAPYSTFTANPFPDGAFSMVAPFWGDVDTRNPTSGVVYIKMTPVSVIIQWDSVGYFDSYADKLNTFQLIISNGTDPVIPNGNNVSFCYKDMQWTSGDASGGTNGFGGEPATVGANKGDGINYIQFGRFDKPGSVFDGPFGNADGIDWLDQQEIYFNTCASANIAPVVTDFNVCESDTMVVCEKETLNIAVAFQAPEFGQTTFANAEAPGVDGFSIVSNTFGNTANLNLRFIGTSNNIGYNTVTISAVDNGNPVQTTTFNIVVLVEPAPEIIVSPQDTAICVTVPINLSATGASLYNWSPASSLSSATDADVIATPPGDITYTVTGVGSNGCKDTAFSTITFGGLQTAVYPQNATICEGDSVELIAMGGVNHTWSPAAGLDKTTGDTIYAKPSVSSTYYLSSDSSGCVGYDSTTITVNVIPDVNILPLNPEICYGGKVDLIASGAYNYLWSPETELSTAVDDTVSAYPAFTTTFYVLGNLSGCTDSDSVTVIVNPLPVVSINPSQPVICEFDTAVLTASGADIYLWTADPTLNVASSGNVKVYPADTFTYHVKGYDEKGCADSDSVAVIVKFNDLAEAGPDQGFCTGDSGLIGYAAIPGCTYSWFPADELEKLDSSFTKVTFTNNSDITDTRKFFLEVMYDGCPDTDSVSVSVYPLPVAICEVSPLTAGINAPVSFNSNSINEDQCHWNFGTDDSITGCTTVYAYPKEGDYEISLRVISAYGCESDTTCTVEITKISFYIPNTFTPNGDGINDDFSIIGRNIFDFKMSIFDRWGDLIFKTENLEQRWDGTVENKLAPQGVYVYKMEFKDITGKVYKPPIGRVTLLR